MNLPFVPNCKLLHFIGNFACDKKRFLFAVLVMTGGLSSTVFSQKLTIHPSSCMVLNGQVSLVVNNAAFQNSGTFSAGNSTVNFSGHHDTVVSYVSGTSSTIFHNLSVSKSDYGVALKSAVVVKNVLAVNSGNLYTDSNLTLRSDAGLTARVDLVPSGSNIIGKVNVERYIPAKRAWRLMTAPVTNSNTIYNSWQNRGIYAAGLGLLVTGPNPTAAAGNGLDYSTQNTVSMKGFNYITQQFSNVLNTKVAISTGNNGRADNTGYFVFIRGDRDPANTNINNSNTTTLNSIGVLQTGTQTFIASPVYSKYTLIGNPYASPVDFDKVTRTNLVKRFYVWDPALNSLGGYVMLDDLNNDGVYVKSVMGSSQTKDIQSSQAFFVQTNSNAAASIIFNETSKSGNNNNLMFRPLTPNTPAGGGTGQVIITLNLLDAGFKTILADGAIAEFDNIYSAGIDLDDALKFTNTNENISIVRNNVLLAAERRPAPGINDTVYLKLTNTTQRSYQFEFEVSGLDHPGIEGFLEDSYLGTSTFISLSGTTKVNFTITAATASAAANRFKIVFRPAVSTLPVTISSLTAIQRNSNIAVEWKVENEINIAKYEVERSADGATFTKVHTTMATGANNAYNTYSWLDVNAAQGNNFYRIKSFDRGGAIKYSSIVKVVLGKNVGGITIYPNPVTGNEINLLMNNQPAGKYRVKMTNTNGQLIFVKTIQINGGNSTLALTTGSKLSPGIYLVEIIGQNNLGHSQKVIVE